jgi:hypothetical protein
MPSLINSDDGVVSGSAGLKTTGSNDGILALQNNGTTNVTVTAAGNVGIGTSSPSTKLNVQTAGADVEIRASTTTSGDVRVGFDAVGAFYNWIQTQRSSGTMQFATANAQQAAITTAGLFQFNSGYGSVATAYGCRAWVNFNGTGTPAIRASGNVSSITDIGTGRYTINITTAFPDANYSVVFGMNNAVDATFIKLGNTINGVATLTTTTVPFVSTYNYAAALVDYADIYVAIFR